jgi:hypothetical protein
LHRSDTTANDQFPSFSVDFMKDFECILSTAANTRSLTFLTSLVHQMFVSATAEEIRRSTR